MHARGRVHARVLEPLGPDIAAGQGGGIGAPADQLAQEAALAAADVDHAHRRQVRAHRQGQQGCQRPGPRGFLQQGLLPVPILARLFGAMPLPVDSLDAVLLHLLAHGRPPRPP